MNGTKQDLNGQTDTTEQETDFDKVMAALAAGDTEALSKFESGDDTPEDDETESEVNDQEEGNVEQDDTLDEVDNTAASGEEPDAAEELPDWKTEKQQLEQELHRYKSDAGRVPNLQRRLAEMEKELRARTPTARNHEVPEVPVGELPPELKRKIDSLREIDPELAETLELMGQQAQAGAIQYTEQQLRQREQYQEEQAANDFYEEQMALLTQQVPEHQQIFSMPQWPEWKAGLTPGQRAMTESGYASDMVIAINAYRHYLQQTGQLPAPENPAVNEEAKKVQQARARKQESSVNTKGTPAKKEEPYDEEKFFIEMYNKLGKESNIFK